MKKLCDENCNNCPVIGHPNNRMVTKILNELLNKFGDDVYPIVQKNCPNLTVCYDCRVDDFCHDENCELSGTKSTEDEDDEKLVPFSRVVVINPYPPEFKFQYPFKVGEILLYLGEIVGMEGHHVVANDSGKIFWGYHPEIFKPFKEDGFIAEIQIGEEEDS